jgi:hypothetical protein
MSESATEMARRLGMNGPSLLKQLRRIVKRLLDRQQHAARLFLDDDGELKPAAKAWFGQIAHDNFVTRSAWHEDAREHAKREGRRELALEIINSTRLDVERLEALTRLEREVE